MEATLVSEIKRMLGVLRQAFEGDVRSMSASLTDDDILHLSVLRDETVCMMMLDESDFEIDNATFLQEMVDFENKSKVNRDDRLPNPS